MATVKPRLTITLEPHTYAVITELARLQARPRARVISELIESTAPVLERTCYVLSLAARASSGFRDDFKDSLEASEAKLNRLMDEAMGQMDMLSSTFSCATSDDDGKGKQSASRVDATSSLPPHSNTGVTIGDKLNNSSKNN